MLKIKPNVSFGNTRAAFISQTGAQDYLAKKGIVVVRADKYAKDWQQEEAKREVLRTAADKNARRDFASDFTELKYSFPKLYECLAKYLTVDDVVQPGKSIDDILAKERLLQCQISANQQLFMQALGSLQLNGVKYNFNDIRWIELNSFKYLVWGEYWLEGDGDLLLFEPTNDTMYYLGHGSKGIAPKKLGLSFKEFIEHDLVGFIIENES